MPVHGEITAIEQTEAEGRLPPFLPAAAGIVLGALTLFLLDELVRRRGEGEVHSDFLLLSAITLHNIPEGMAVSVPLAAGGMGKVKATILTALTGAPTILGAMLGYFLGTLSPVMLALSLSFASGAMLYVVFGELLPESILMWRSKAPAFAMLAGVLVGVVILFV